MLARTSEQTHPFAFGFNVPRIWVPLTARPSKEQDAADWLKRSGFRAYWPCYMQQIHAGSGRRRVRFTPVMPGYLFMALPADERLWLCDPHDVIEQAPGLNGMIRGSDGKPLPIQESDIAVIRNIEAGLNLPWPDKANHRFKVGDKVRFIDDLLGRWPAGHVVGLVNGEGISIETHLLGRAVRITARASQIEAM